MTTLLPINQELNKAALSLEDKLQTCGDPNFFLDLELLKEGTNVRSKCSSVEELTECGAYKFRSAWGMNILARKVIERSLKYAAANEDQEPNSLLTWYEGYQLRVLLALNPPDEDVYDVGYPELGLGGAVKRDNSAMETPDEPRKMPRTSELSTQKYGEDDEEEEGGVWTASSSSSGLQPSTVKIEEEEEEEEEEVVSLYKPSQVPVIIRNGLAHDMMTVLNDMHQDVYIDLEGFTPNASYIGQFKYDLEHLKMRVDQALDYMDFGSGTGMYSPDHGTPEI